MFFFFFFNDTATTEIYTLSLHDALPISIVRMPVKGRDGLVEVNSKKLPGKMRSEEHTSELQSQSNLVCRLLLEKKNMNTCSNHLAFSARPVRFCRRFDSRIAELTLPTRR